MSDHDSARRAVAHTPKLLAPEDQTLELPPALEQAMFGQKGPDADAGGPATYAILDAAANPFVPELLDATELEHRCLFAGEAEAEMADSAPWLVRIGREDRLLRALFTEGPAPWHLWGRGLGVFMQANAGFDDMRTHLRRFLKVRDRNGKWYFFRFWEPATAAAFFCGLQPGEANHSAWVLIGSERCLQRVFIPGHGGILHEIGFSPLSEANQGETRASFVLTRGDVDRMGEALARASLLELAALAVHPGDPLAAAGNTTEAPAIAFARKVRAGARALGVSSKTDEERLVRLCRLYGLEFYRDPRVPRAMPDLGAGPSAQLYAILDRREPFADMLEGPDGQGGLDPAFLATDGSWTAFAAALRSPLPPEAAAAFYSRAERLDIGLPRALKLWCAYYFGLCFPIDPRFGGLGDGSVNPASFDPVAVADWLRDAIRQSPEARPI